MSTKTKIPTGWTKPRPKPQEPEIDWVSIEKLLDEYTIPTLAEAVEKLDVLTHDDTGRRILATNGDVTDIESKAFALRHLELRYSMQNNPGPDDYLYDEMLETHGSPLDLFGWPRPQLPNLDSINPHYSPKTIATTNLTTLQNWINKARAIGQAYIDRNRENDLHPSLNDTSKHVANELRKLKIYGVQQKPMSADSVKRQALQGDWWKKRNASNRQ